jgi:ABC-type transport system substrate-binding protein
LFFFCASFTDLRVRQAANYAISRTGIKDMLDGLMIKGYSAVPPGTAALLKAAKCYPGGIGNP